MNDEFTDRVIACVARVQRIDPEGVTLDSSFEELGLDSLDAISVLFELETEFSISIGESLPVEAAGVRDIAREIWRFLGEHDSEKGG